MANPSPLDKGLPGSQPALEKKTTGVEEQMRQLAKETLGSAVRVQLDDQVFREQLPALWDWLTAVQIAEEFRKEPARLLCNVDGSAWKVTLSDNSLQCSLTASGNTFQEALTRLNGALLQADAPWNRWKKRGRKLEALEGPEKKAGQQKKRK